MISASRMRRAQERAIAARPYAEKTRELLRRLAQAEDAAAVQPLLARRPVRRLLVVVMASDRGLCGGYNNNVIRLARDYVEQRRLPAAYVGVGRKACEAIARAQGELMAAFDSLPTQIDMAFASVIARTVEDAFLSGEVDAAVVAFTRFVSTMVHTPVIRQLLPVVPGRRMGREEEAERGDNHGEEEIEYIYEPAAEAILNTLLPRSLEVEVLACLLESAASEHSARMVAMQNATENAEDMVDDLVREYNRARQTSITNEILDIAGGAEALRRASV